MTTDLATNGHANRIEKALVAGNLTELSVDERLVYYKQTCESVGLNPLTRPFDYIVLNNKLTLYARKDCTEQLRKLHAVSIRIVGREVVEDCYVVTAKAMMPNGREDESTGAVSIAGIKGEARANAMMKAETKAKRRVTLSICGLGMLDETEIESIPDAYRNPDMSPEANTIPVQDQLAARQANPRPRKEYCTQQQRDALRDIADELGLSGDDRCALLRQFNVKRVESLTPDQCNEVILTLLRRRIGELLSALQWNLDDVRNEMPNVTADEPDELPLEQAAEVLDYLRKVKDERQVT